MLTAVQPVEAGLGMGVAAQYYARRRPKLIALTPARESCRIGLGLLTHPESRHLCRIAMVSAQIQAVVEELDGVSLRIRDFGRASQSRSAENDNVAFLRLDAAGDQITHQLPCRVRAYMLANPHPRPLRVLHPLDEAALPFVELLRDQRRAAAPSSVTRPSLRKSDLPTLRPITPASTP